MTTLNDPKWTPPFRQPRLQVILLAAGEPGQTDNGTGQPYVSPPLNQPIPYVISASVSSNNYYQADTFTLEFAIPRTPESVGFWGEQPRLLVDVQISMSGDGWASLIIGQIDSVSIDPIGGRVECSGRDLSAQLIEARTAENFSNQTASQIATTLAARHGLKAKVTTTTTLSGRYLQDRYTAETASHYSHSTTEWDLLVKLARYEGFDCYVFGQTLYFNPRIDPSSAPYALLCDLSTDPVTGNCNVSLSRALTLARDIEVRVKSYDSRNQRGFEKVARAAGAKGAQHGHSSDKKLDKQIVYIVRPNLTEVDAQTLANNTLREMSRHERIIEASMPGDLILTPRMMVSLQGTGTKFDQVYYADQVTRHIHFQQGFTMTLRAKNRSAESWGYIDTASTEVAPPSPATQGPVPLQIDSQLQAAIDARLGPVPLFRL